jgi:muramoyltetrapeptide carboxypeptidase
MKTWRKLKKNDVVCIIAPSSELHSKERGVEWIIRQYNLQTYIYPNITVPGNHSVYDQNNLPLANSDEIRANHFLDALNNPECKIVWASPGGYGAIRVVRRIINASAPIVVKPFIGFSDVTLLHLFINKKWGWPSIHFGMPGAKGLNDTLVSDSAIQDITSILFAHKHMVSFTVSKMSSEGVDKKIIGITSGANLLTFSRTFGTEIQPDLANKILVFEEVAESVRKVDGMLQQLQMLSGFSKVSAVVFGSFSSLPEEGDNSVFNKILDDFAVHSNVPVFKLLHQHTIGHDSDINKALPLGTSAEIYDNEGTFYMAVNTGVTQDLVHGDL